MKYLLNKFYFIQDSETEIGNCNYESGSDKRDKQLITF